MNNPDQNPIPAPEADTNGEAPKKLTINDPVPRETLQRLALLTEAKGQVAMRMLELEQEKIQCLGQAKRLGEENERLFTAILMERGLAPGTVVSIDGQTGKLTLVGQDDGNTEQAEG